jgi:hypothetical protein
LHDKPLQMVELQKVKPTKALLCIPMPCEEQAARIRNKTVDDIQRRDTPAVYYRYHQSKKGQLKTQREANKLKNPAVCCIFLLFITIYLEINDHMHGRPNSNFKMHAPYEPPLLMLLASAYAFGNYLPNRNNAAVYRETKQGAKQFLRQELGNERFNNLRKKDKDFWPTKQGYMNSIKKEITRLRKLDSNLTSPLDHKFPSYIISPCLY